jgi:thiol-disulfide isomerase/thioredoxin
MNALIKFSIVGITLQILFFVVLLSNTSAFNYKDLDRFLVGSLKGFQIAEENNKFADFPFYDELGKNLKISDYKGNFIILNIWATWCIPCREEMPSLDRLQHSFKDEKLRVLAISQDRAGKRLVKNFYKEMKIRHLDIFIDSPGYAKRMVGAFMLPTTIVIGPDGIEIGRLLGGANWDSKEAVSLMRNLLRGN